MEPKRLLNLKEVSVILNCSRSTLYRIIRAGEIITVSIRGSIRVPYQSVTKYIEDHSTIRTLAQRETA